MQIYLVGGAVRDALLNRPVSERDWVVVGATPEQMLAQNFKPVGNDFPVFLHPETGEEYALARTERKTGRGYTGFTFYTDTSVTLEDDLVRRDLTINAIAQDKNGDLIDPYNGTKDIEARILRHVSPAFSEDPLRVLRVARFAARYHSLEFKIAEETLALMTDLAESGELDHLTAERVWKEMSRALEGDDPHIFFQVLRDCGALSKLLPELDRLFGVPQPPKYHPEIDTGIHCLMALQQICKLDGSAEARFATLTHDLGKGTTPKNLLPSHHGHEERGIELIHTVCNRLKVQNTWRELAVLVSEFHTHCHRAPELKPTTLLSMLERLDAFRRPERFEQFCRVCTADARGRTGFENTPYRQADYLRSAHEQVAGIAVKEFIDQGLQGHQVGDALRAERLRVLHSFKKEWRSEQA